MFSDLSLAVNIAIFCAAALAVWLAGTRLTHYADAIAQKTGIARELIGILLLGAVTSLPELAVATTASLAGAPALSVGDLLGSAAVNLVILAVADAVYGRGALTSTLASPGVVLQGVLGIVLLGLVLAPVLTGDRLVLGMGVWSWLMLATYVASICIIANSQRPRSWVPAREVKQEKEDAGPAILAQRPLKRLMAGTVLMGGAILAAGFVLASTGESIAEQSGIAAGFIGAAFLAIATSLPELSTVIAAVRLRRYEMAIADIFGTNLFNVTIIVLVDLLYAGEPVLVQVGGFAAFGALLAIVMTALFLVGMIERRNRTVFRMGIDSILVLACYAGGLVVLYRLS
jgi:cation:H+ antiporter